MTFINPIHISAPGLVVLEVVAGDEETARTAVETLERLWPTSGPSVPWRVPGEEGVHVRTFADIRRTAEDVWAEAPCGDGGLTAG
ncbi:DUF6207 family protein [Streptomyces sp. NPDC001404]|uniref:DUF6207 family protein n=1 Tax=Streptomyces sp. NPDC001404 TaxID=3364571 RepID=UPI00369DBB75